MIDKGWLDSYIAMIRETLDWQNGFETLVKQIELYERELENMELRLTEEAYDEGYF